MKSKIRNRFVICGGAMAIALLAGVLLSHPSETASPPQIRPVCDFVPEGKDAPPPVSKTDDAEPVSSENSTLTVPMSDAAPEPQPIVESVETMQPQPPPAAQTQSVSSPPDEPKMGDTRTVDGQKQVYFLGFGWIEDNHEPNECIYVEDMYENGNKIGSMGGGTLVDGDGDINKMVGTMDGGEVGRRCGDINKMVGIMGE